MLRCPRCRSDSVMTTLIGCTGYDINKVSCMSCGASGTAGDWYTIDALTRRLDTFLDTPTGEVETNAEEVPDRS